MFYARPVFQMCKEHPKGLCSSGLVNINNAKFRMQKISRRPLFAAFGAEVELLDEDVIDVPKSLAVFKPLLNKLIFVTLQY